MSLNTSLKVTKQGHVIAQAEGLSLPVTNFVCLVGPSGAGKSTLGRALALLEDDAEGTLEIFEHAFRLPATSAPLRLVTYVDQEAELWPHLTVRQAANAVVAEHRLDPKYLAHVAAKLGAEEFWHRRPDQLSGGERHRAALLLGLALESRLLIADESTSQLDTRSRRAVIETLIDAAANRGIVLITHDLPVVDYLAAQGRLDQYWFMSDSALRVTGDANSWLKREHTQVRDFVEAVTLRTTDQRHVDETL